jgi:hypothetical protein
MRTLQDEEAPGAPWMMREYLYQRTRENTDVHLSAPPVRV